MKKKFEAPALQHGFVSKVKGISFSGHVSGAVFQFYFPLRDL